MLQSQIETNLIASELEIGRAACMMLAIWSANCLYSNIVASTGLRKPRECIKLNQYLSEKVTCCLKKYSLDSRVSKMLYISSRP